LKRSKKLWCTICATAKKGFLFIKRGGLGVKRLKMARVSREDLRGIFKDYTLPIPKHRPPYI
jgi:hypothetical protein